MIAGQTSKRLCLRLADHAECPLVAAQAPRIINRRPAILSLPQYLHGSIADASDGLPDYSSQHAQLAASHAATADSTEAGLFLVATRTLLLLQTPLSSPRRAMFRKESRRESRHTIAETSNSDRRTHRGQRDSETSKWGSCVSWPAREPLNPMLRVEINTKHVARMKGPADDADGAMEHAELPDARCYSCLCLCIVVLVHPSTEPTSMAIAVT
jgi:hypothetical protein